MYFQRFNNSFITLCVVVDDIAFASNDTNLITHFKAKMKASFEVKLYGELKLLIRWSIICNPSGIIVHRKDYATRLLARFSMSQSNAVLTPLPTNADLSMRHSDEARL